MRRTIKNLALAGVLAIGGLAGLGTASAQAQGYGAYPGGGVYGPGYPVGPAYGPAYGGSGGGLNIGLGIGGYPAPFVGGNRGYGNVGYGGGYSHHHSHHRHHRGCGHY